MYRTVDRSIKDSKGRYPNIIESKWFFYIKVDAVVDKEYKARIVTRGFKVFKKCDRRKWNLWQFDITYFCTRKNSYGNSYRN